MIAEEMKPYVKNNSAIRMMFEEGNRLRAIYGADKVYDFSLGNPSVPAPEGVKEAIIDLVNEVELSSLSFPLKQAISEPEGNPHRTIHVHCFSAWNPVLPSDLKD